MMRKTQIKLSVAALFGVAALLLCIIMSIHSLSGSELVGCGAGSACDSVLGGRWSKLFGIFPISGIAAGAYLAFLLAVTVFLLSKDEGLKDMSSKALLLISGAIIGSAVWFVGLQIIAEGEFCKYCMTTHALGIVCAVLTASGLLRGTRSGGGWMAVGAGLAALLAALQVLTVPDSVYQEGTGEEVFPLISSDEAPVIGNPEAEYVIDLLYDYQCSHCRTVHEQLPEVIRQFDGRVAFVLCPCPLSPKCNPYVPREETRFEGSCDLARLALAVYELEPEAFADFDGWLFGAGESAWRPRATAAVRERAASIVGKDKLEALLPDASLSESIRRAADLFGRTSTRSSAGIPRFVFGDRWVVPSADTAEDLAKILSEQFGIR
jgi:protein-disulfide isomerase